jgi:hypothetical protein
MPLTSHQGLDNKRGLDALDEFINKIRAKFRTLHTEAPTRSPNLNTPSTAIAVQVLQKLLYQHAGKHYNADLQTMSLLFSEDRLSSIPFSVSTSGITPPLKAVLSPSFRISM